MNKNFFKVLSGMAIVALLTGCGAVNNEESASLSSESTSSLVSSTSASVSSSSSVAESSSAEEASVTEEASFETESSEGAVSQEESESEAILEETTEQSAESESANEIIVPTEEEVVQAAESESEVVEAKEETVETPSEPAATVSAGWGDWYIEDGTWHQESDPSYNRWVGDSALIVNYDQQTMWAILDGEILFETPITTGRPGEETPLGFFEIQHKESPSVLIGPDYEQPVNFWMPFIGNMWGFHDATWQESFGGTRYLEGAGSRGCINMPYWAAELMFNNYGAGEEVIIF